MSDIIGISPSRHHADWLSLVEVSGPFVSLPVLLRVFQHGLDPRDPTQAKELRAAYEQWQDNPTAPGLQRAWVLHVLSALLGYAESQIAEGQSLPAGLEANMAQMGETLRPDFALVGPPGSDTSGQTQLLITYYPAVQKLDRPVVGKYWKATPATRMMELLHGTGVSLGLVSNGEHWMLVYAPRGETTGYASWFSSLWLDEPVTLRAFHSLLGSYRFFSAAANNTLLAMLKESAQDQQEVTDQLGYQVREAVEVLVQSFDALDKESGRRLLKGVAETALYEAALTIMMRLVFLFSAEERDLLHLGKPLYDNNYAVSTLQEQLQEVADRYGEEVLERRLDAWARLLATFRAVHGGIQHQDLMMQAYGGSLFNPDRYPFLEGRPANTDWHSITAEPLAVNNRVVLHLLNSLQRLRMKAGSAAETRRVSFRALGVEQIGHVYEGLLDHTAVRANQPMLGIKGTRGKETEISLATMESLLAQGQDKLIVFLKGETGRSTAALRRALDAGGLLDEHKLLVACGQDTTLLTRVRPFASLIREDSFECPMVVLEGSVYVTTGTARRSTGTHYTPPALTEPIVQHTLEPLVYEGPVEGMSREKWKLRPPKIILDLKICDIAMGSGAFLVQACRYLAERLVEAWEIEEKQHAGEVLITPDSSFSQGSPNERLIPAEAHERMAVARRLIADRCLYGVDINPMAVEMAKLSLWLITVDANRPFTFLDHAFKCGDSLLGITSLEQLENFRLQTFVDADERTKVDFFPFATLNLRCHIDEAKKKREELEAMPSDTPEQVAAKAVLYADAKISVDKLNSVADVLMAVELKGLVGRAYDMEREAWAGRMMNYWEKGISELQNRARESHLVRHCFHWAMEFPEIVGRGGFDALIGNPPFVGGTLISGRIGKEVQTFISRHYGKQVKSGGRADLCAYFFVRANQLVRKNGTFGLIATNTISEGDTREVGLGQLLALGSTIYRANSSVRWPGDASLEVAEVWCQRGPRVTGGSAVLDGKEVNMISSFLSDSARLQSQPHRMEANKGMACEGSKPLGMGFVLSEEEATSLILRDAHNKAVLFKYINGDDLNSHPQQLPSRWIVNFHDWPMDKETAPVDYAGPVANDFRECFAIVEERVKPERTRKKDNGQFVLRAPLPDRWWQYAEKRAALYAALAQLPRFLAVARVSKHLAFVFVDPGIVVSEAIVAIPNARAGLFAILQSSFHEVWVREFQSSLETRGRYTPSDCLETFPLPEITHNCDIRGAEFHDVRRRVMLKEQEGLTKIYNRFHDSNESLADIVGLRRVHVEMDLAVAAAFGWADLDLCHDFHESKHGLRYTISESARREILDRLLKLNHQRYMDEETMRAAQAAPAKRGRKKQDATNQMLMDL